MLRTLLTLALALPLLAATPESDIRKVLDDQAAAWNRADITSFMTGYEDSPNTAFVGTSVTRGYAGVLERYRTKYSSKDKMGTLHFSEVEVQMLGEGYANVIGRFHLDRTKEAGGEATGLFTLVFKKTAKGWKIIVDHTA